MTQEQHQPDSSPPTGHIWELVLLGEGLGVTLWNHKSCSLTWPSRMHSQEAVMHLRALGQPLLFNLKNFKKVPALIFTPMAEQLLGSGW